MMVFESNRLLSRFLLVLWGIGFAVTGKGATGDRDVLSLKFDRLNYLNAGPSGQVSDIVQGPRGFIWFGTQEGAHRFNGYEVRTFSNDKDDPNSLINSSVLEFYIDHEERFWVGTEKGLSLYLPETESFRNYYLDPKELNSNLANRVNSILRDSANRIYASTESGYVYRFDEAVDRFDPINERSMGIIKSMVIDERDRLWVGADSEVFVYDLESGEIASHGAGLEPDDPSVDNFMGSICYVNDETVWLATTTRGAVVYNSLSGEFREMERAYSSEEYAHFIMRDELSRVWVGHSGGITIYSEEGEFLTRHVATVMDRSLPRSGIHSILLDKQGNVWAGSAFHGVFVSINGKKFNSLPRYSGRKESDKAVVSSLMQDQEGNLWVGLNSTGIDIIPLDGGAVKELRNDPEDERSLALNTVFALHEDSRGEIWVGTYRGGLQRYVPETNDFDRYVNEPGNEQSLAGNDVRGIEEDAAGNLWVLAHGRGISYFDRSTEAFTTYRNDPNDPEGSLIDNWAHAILCDSRGNLYVGTSVGLSILDPETNSFRNFEGGTADGDLSDPVVNVLYEDSTGRIWVGTSDGINLFDPELGRFESWSVEDGLSNRAISSILEDPSGNLWIGTENGLSRFDPQTGHFDNYDESDGLPDNVFFPRAMVRVEEGQLYFGTKDGVAYFDHSEIKDNQYLPSVWIDEFMVFNRPLEIDPDAKGRGFLKRSILEADQVVLDYQQKVISIGYVALNFVQPNKNRYAYKLEGFDRDWNFVGTRREATYTNLNPGSYVFKVRAANNDGYWNNSPKTLSIVIEPPFWQTIAFRVAAGFVIVLIPALVVFLRLRSERALKVRLETTVKKRTSDLRRANDELGKAYSQLARNQTQIKTQNSELVKHRENLESMVSKRTQELETAKEKAERSDRLKSAFLANMSHEIRTPMNAIIGLLDVMQIESLTPSEKNEYTEVIKKSSDTLMTLIDDILDLSRIESGEANLVPQLCNCDELCEEIFALFRHVASVETSGAVALKLERNGLDGVRGEKDLVLPDFDPVRLKQIISNLLSNAIKFTEEGEIVMGYRTEALEAETKIIFFVKDSGIGIPENQVNRVFDRFHKVDATNGKVYRGTGLGLTISKRLAEMMGGTISLESKEGVGTTFYVSFTRSGSLGQYPNPGLADDGQSEGEASGRDESLSLSGIKVLVAEDEIPNFLVLKKYLESAGAATTWAKDGAEAIKLFESGSYDIALLDVKLPLKDGLSVLKHIRSVNTHIPVVIQTAFALEDVQQKSKELGASAFVTKPFNRSRLIAVFQKLLGNARI